MMLQHAGDDNSPVKGSPPVPAVPSLDVTPVRLLSPLRQRVFLGSPFQFTPMMVKSRTRAELFSPHFRVCRNSCSIVIIIVVPPLFFVIFIILGSSGGLRDGRASNGGGCGRKHGCSIIWIATIQGECVLFRVCQIPVYASSAARSLFSSVSVSACCSRMVRICCLISSAVTPGLRAQLWKLVAMGSIESCHCVTSSYAFVYLLPLPRAAWRQSFLKGCAAFVERADRTRVAKTGRVDSWFRACIVCAWNAALLLQSFCGDRRQSDVLRPAWCWTPRRGLSF